MPLHDSEHPDHVTSENHTRNVWRTPANNKLRMEDKRQEEHIKLATEYGKSQLNMGHLVNAQREQRGAGFELRTDEFGAVRAAKGLYLTADEQAKAQGPVLEMAPAINQINQANSQMQAPEQRRRRGRGPDLRHQYPDKFCDRQNQGPPVGGAAGEARRREWH